MNEWILGLVSGIPPPPPHPNFAGADDIIANLAKAREPGIEVIERTSYIIVFLFFSYKLLQVMYFCLV